MGDAPLDPSILESMLDARFVVSVAAPKLCDDQLFPDELRYVARAVETRRAEFGTARVCARRALARLGLDAGPLVPDQDRSPCWPPGIKGSISHTRSCCAVAVTDAPEVVGLGIDIEEDTPLGDELVRMICTEEEQLWVRRMAPRFAGCLAKLVFSAKEAFYKCQYVTTRAFIDFREVHLKVDLAGGAFSVARIEREGEPWNRVQSVRGRFRQDFGFIATSAVLTSDTSPLTKGL